MRETPPQLDFAEFCPCGWDRTSDKPHNHAKRLARFKRARNTPDIPQRIERDKPKSGNLHGSVSGYKGRNYNHRRR